MSAAIAVPTAATVTAVAATMTAGMTVAMALGGCRFGDCCQAKA
ncbi:hypothetical protein [Methylorubrum suomiense]|jgi:hypothetical protein|nr:hypothetical protein [Methylorubrum suomiense]